MAVATDRPALSCWKATTAACRAASSTGSKCRTFGKGMLVTCSQTDDSVSTAAQSRGLAACKGERHADALSDSPVAKAGVVTG